MSPEDYFRQVAPQWVTAIRAKQGEFYRGFKAGAAGEPSTGILPATIESCGWRHGNNYREAIHGITTSTDLKPARTRRSKR